MMPILLNKSEQNNTACTFLINKELYAPAVHCAYYACLQKIIYIWENFYEEDLDYVNQIVKTSTHKYYIKEFSTKIRDNFDRRDGLELKNRLNDLKTCRIESDYKKNIIDASMAQNVKDTVSVILNIIKKHTEI